MKYEYWFANIKGISNRRKREIRERILSAERLYNMEEKAMAESGILNDKEISAIISGIRNWNIEEEYKKLEDKGVRFVTVNDESYPGRLCHIPSAPYALYVKGKLPCNEGKTVAIVGARECTQYGETMAGRFAAALAKAKVQVISGMARGIDSAAQRGAVMAGGLSFAVLGCGVDICYPKEEYALYRELCLSGGVISEFPPGVSPLPRHFPARNRIISGLSDIVLVMEAKERSGSLITADMALEQGKDVYALPGPVTSRLSRGCNALIRQGAGILLSPEDLLMEMGIEMEDLPAKVAAEDCHGKVALEREEKLVYSCLGFKPQSLDMLVDMTKLNVAELIDILMRLELKGYIKEISKNYYVIQYQ